MNDDDAIELEILMQEGGAADDAEFASAIGCTVPELLARSHRCEYFSVEFRGNRHWPRWQLGLAGLSDVLPTLTEKGVSSFSVLLLFTTPTDTWTLDDALDELPDVCDDDSPLALLRRSGSAAIPRILRHAQRFGEQGAV